MGNWNGNVSFYLILFAVIGMIFQHMTYSADYGMLKSEYEDLEQEYRNLRNNYDAFRDGVIYGKP